MIKKITIGLITIIILFLAGYAYSAQLEKERIELRVKSLAGHNLFLLVTTYQEIESKFSNETFNRESVSNIEDKLVEVKAYSIVADSIVGNDYLQTITSRFQDIFAHLEKSHTKMDLSKEQIQELVEIKSMMKELIDVIYQTYYDKSNDEGGSAELNIKDFSKVESLQKKITEYYNQINKKS
ncbi:hypothetical protein [Brevibacillus sp. HB2.2]|uniref:hypothetical protein n=1 Tax=Brevibacillus sp. HB2.2 TaxID=2738846 RepID=UPI00156B327F|nr:hypothetical protein [Brevibacillus sp. HB2.2]NRS51760.1 hypothetical protein [Brevibacillus sp. HB2.2]